MLDPKKKKGIEEVAEIARKGDVVSLTKAIFRAIPHERLAKMKTAEEYIAELIRFYTPAKREVAPQNWTG
jgi:hypothetical protein